MTRARFNLVLVSLIVTACGKKKVKIARGRPAPKPTVPAVIGSTETGMASWYGHPYHGRQAADGEIYDMEKLVAAHRTLQINTWVRVTNLSNSKTVDVRIIDRGPFVGGRIIDLSHAAAQKVDLIGPGVAQVRVEIIAPPQSPEPALFGVQVGVFAFRVNADKMMQDMQTRYGAAKVVARQGMSTTWRVVVGRESSADSAESLAVKIRSAESLPQSFVVRLDP
jgi:peptidoglycan lytic transglycosylase